MQNSMEIESKNNSTGDSLRFLRKLNRMSQMDLAIEVDISTKQLSFVKTGMSKHGSNLVLKMANPLKLPLRHSKFFLNAAGYGDHYGIKKASYCPKDAMLGIKTKKTAC